MQDGKEHLIKDVVPLVDLNDIVFGGWIFSLTMRRSRNVRGGFERKDLNLVKMS